MIAIARRERYGGDWMRCVQAVEAEYRVTYVYEGDVARALESQPDALILDATASVAWARDVLQRFQAAWPTMPPVLLLVPDATEEDEALAWLEAAAAWTLPASFVTAPRLARALRGLLEPAEAEQEHMEVAQAEQDRWLHDVRGPLNAAIGYAELLAEDLASRGEDDLAGDATRVALLGRRLLTLVTGVGTVDDSLPPPEAAPEAPARGGDVPDGDRSPLASEGPILVIDDDADVRGLLRRYLEAAGFEVVSAHNGAEGLALAQRLLPAAITLDVVMPGMDGWAVLRALREQPSLVQIPVVMMTGQGSERTAAQALREGVGDYLIKGDITGTSLRRAVEGVLEKKRLLHEVETAQAALLEAHDALRESERRYRLLAENASDLISRHTPDGVFLYASPSAQAVLGYSPEALQGRSIWSLLPPDEPLAGQREGSPLPPDGKSYRLQTRDGTQRWVETRWRQVEAAMGEVYVAITRDVTDRMEAELALARLNETLEERVEAQTHQLRALASSLTLAEQRERQRISRVLHDHLQQHLYGLQVRLQLISRRLPAASLAAIETPLTQLARMTREAISMARTLSVELSPPVLHEASFEAVMAWLAAQMEEMHGLRVEIESGAPCEVQREEMRVLLFQFVREILFNAVKHAGVEHAQVLLQRDAQGLRIDVVDQGAGFDVETLKTRRPAQGGWGLPSIRERLSLFRGTFVIESAPGHGTRMTLTVPPEALEDRPAETIGSAPTMAS